MYNTRQMKQIRFDYNSKFYINILIRLGFHKETHKMREMMYEKVNHSRLDKFRRMKRNDQDWCKMKNIRENLFSEH